MINVTPNLQWYLSQSSLKGLTPRCPFASVKQCPRFYQSLSLLGKAGSTQIPKKDDKKLQKKWKKNFLWPVTDEQATSISGPQKTYNTFSNFCPEVSYDRYGLFASHLSKYSNEIDIELAHSHLENIKASSDDWRWVWSNISNQHYSECSLYSILLSYKRESQSKSEDIITINPSIYGFGIDINALWRKIKNRYKHK